MFVFAAGWGGAVAAQGLNNQPYDFGGGGLGMSAAGKQAILSGQLGIRPENLLIGPGGVLFYAQRGPGGSPMVYEMYAAPVPTFYGSGWRNGWFGMRATQPLFFIDRPDGAMSTAASLNTWTGTVCGDDALFAGYLLPMGFNTLDLLMVQVYTLSPQ